MTEVEQQEFAWKTWVPKRKRLGKPKGSPRGGGKRARVEHSREHELARERIERAAREEAQYAPGAWWELREEGGAKPRYAGARVGANRVVEVLRQGPTCDVVRTASGAVKLINRAREAEEDAAGR